MNNFISISWKMSCHWLIVKWKSSHCFIQVRIFSLRSITSCVSYTLKIHSMPLSLLFQPLVFDCRYSYDSLYTLPQKPLYFTDKYLEVKTVLADTFFGPPNRGVYSPSVQNTLYLMAKATLNRLFVSLLSLHLTDI